MYASGCLLLHPLFLPLFAKEVCERFLLLEALLSLGSSRLVCFVVVLGDWRDRSGGVRRVGGSGGVGGVGGQRGEGRNRRDLVSGVDRAQALGCRKGRRSFPTKVSARSGLQSGERVQHPATQRRLLLRIRTPIRLGFLRWRTGWSLGGVGVFHRRETRTSLEPHNFDHRLRLRRT